MTYTKQQHKEVASQMERDSTGHFIKKAADSTKEALKDFKEEHVHYDKHLGGILDVHVRDPFERIAQILEELKRQKAFAFTLKGSLGLAGVAVALSVFGFFGGSKILCDKGVQTQIGTIKVLQFQESDESKIPIIGWMVDYLSGKLGTSTLQNRVILEASDKSTIHIPSTSLAEMTKLNGAEVYASGKYDSCSKVLKIQNLEKY